jgi:hypothetical protein
MENSLKEKLQNKLNHHFNIFLEEKINGERFRIMPPSSEIPKIIDIKFDKESHAIEILFTPESNVDHSEKVTEIFRYFKDKSDSIIGVQIFINDQSNIEKLKLVLIKNIREELKRINTIEDPLMKLRSDSSKRKLYFFKDLVNSDIEELIGQK